MAEDPTPQPTPISMISEHEIASPRAYRRVASQLLNQMLSGELKSVDYHRMREGVEQACLIHTGMSLEEAGKQVLDKIEAFRGLMAHSEKELDEVIGAIQELEALRMSKAEKKKHLASLRKAISVIRECKRDPAKACIWLARDSKTNSVLRLKGFHEDMIAAWNDPQVPNSLSEAPPGHGKSSLLYPFIAWEIGTDPSLRHLYVTDVKDKAHRAVGVVRRIIESPRYHALFPNIYVLGKSDQRSADSSQFSVNGLYEGSREATLTASSIFGNVNGDGFDRIYGDDMCPPEVRELQTLRERANRRWFQIIVKRLRDHTDARIRIVHQCWHDGDVCGLVKRDIEEGRRKNWSLSLHPILDDVQGVAIPIWPERYPVDFLENEKLHPGYDHLYRLRTTNSQDILVPSVHFYHSDLNHPLTRQADRDLAEKLAVGERWLSIDPAATGNQGSSYTGAVEIIRGDSGFVFVTRAWFLKLEPIALLQWIAEQLFNAADPGYCGLHMESQSAMKMGVNLLEHQLKDILRTGEIPCRNEITGQWETYKHPLEYKRHLEIVNTDTRISGTGGVFRGKRHRLKMAAGILSTPIVKFAGVRKEDHNCPRNEPRRFYCGPLEGSSTEKLASHIVNFDSQPVTDGVDAVTQWLNVNIGRLASYDWKTQKPVEDAQGPAAEKTISQLAQEQILAMDNPEEDNYEAEDMVLDRTLDVGGFPWN